MANGISPGLEAALMVGNFATPAYLASAQVVAHQTVRRGYLNTDFCEGRETTDLAAGSIESYTYQFDVFSVIGGVKLFDKAAAGEIFANRMIQIWVGNTLVFPAGASSSGGAAEEDWMPLALLNDPDNPLGLHIVVPPGVGNTATTVTVKLKNSHASTAADSEKLYVYGARLFANSV